MLETIVPMILTKKTISEASIIQSRLNRVPRTKIPIAKKLVAIGIHQIVKYFFICRRVCFIQISHNVYGYDLALEGRLHERGKLNTLLVPREMQILSKRMYFCVIINASNLPKNSAKL